jgi:hypothetical protein
MAKTINNFLVGIGFDLDKKSVDGVASGIDGVKSKALQLGTVVAGAFGGKALTSDFAAAKDDLAKFGEVYGLTADDIHAFGNALRIEGGTLEGFMSQLSQLEQFRAGLAIGDAEFIGQAGRAGLDVTGLIEAQDAAEGFLELADQFQRMDQQQRLNAANALGLDDATIRLLARGRENIESLVDVQRKMRPVTEEMTEAARIFNEETKDLSNSIGGFADKISVALLPQLNSVLGGMNEWIDLNREFINSGIDDFLAGLGAEAVTIAASMGLIGSGAAVAGAGGLAGKAGLTGTGKALGIAGRGAVALGGVGVAAAGGAAIGTTIKESLDVETVDIIGGTIATALAAFGHEESQRALDARFNATINQPPVQVTTQLVLDGKVLDERTVNVVGGMADQAMQDISSTEGP